ncbi:MAG: hypothetical protein IH616_18555, partial [Gemmatimonadales bacterium]|nr:hypothetical protein [Gemmatimonadales bacterium]
MRASTLVAVLFAPIAAFACGSSHTEQTSPEACDGKWAVRVSSRIESTIEVFDREANVLVGTVAPGGERVSYAFGNSKPRFAVRRIGNRGLYWQDRNHVDVQT